MEQRPPAPSETDSLNRSRMAFFRNAKTEDEDELEDDYDFGIEGDLGWNDRTKNRMSIVVNLSATRVFLRRSRRQ